MFVALVRKHGLVPKTAMPETESSSASGKMNASLRTVLRQGALQLRALHQATPRPSGAQAGYLDPSCTGYCRFISHPAGAIRLAMAGQRPRIPSRGELTPLEFAAKYVTIRWTTMCAWLRSAIEQPAQPHLYGRLSRQRRRRCPVTYLNVDIGFIKDAARRTIADASRSWFRL